MARARGALSTILKLAVSAGLLIYVFAEVEWAEFRTLLGRTDVRYVVVYFIIGPLMLFTSTVKWKVLASAKGLHAPLTRLWALYFIGHFFSHLMPSNVGGDAVRIYKLGRDTGRFEDALASVFTERLAGLTVLLALVLMSLALNLELLLGESRISAGLAFAFVAYAALMWALLDVRLVRFLTTRLRLPLFDRIAPRIESVHLAIRSYGNSPRVWLPALGISLVFYALVILNAYLGCRAFGAAVPLRPLLVAIPVILVITMLPISVGGIGLMEWAYFVMFEMLGLSGPLGLSVALLNRASGLSVAGTGGLLYARSLVAGETREDYVASVSNGGEAAG